MAKKKAAKKKEVNKKVNCDIKQGCGCGGAFYGLGFIFIAITILIALKAKAKRIIIKSITGSLIALSLFSYPHFKLFYDVDACLDQGGRWNKDFHKCEK